MINVSLTYLNETQRELYLSVVHELHAVKVNICCASVLRSSHYLHWGPCAEELQEKAAS